MYFVPSSFQNREHIQNEVLYTSQPSSSTVVIGKGKVAREASGNIQLRSLVQNNLQEYTNAKSKMEKSSIVTEIYDAIKEACFQEGGGPVIVRYDGHYYIAVPESAARIKITSVFRNRLHDRYKSSSKNKAAKRRLAHKEKTETDQQRLRTQQQTLLELAPSRQQDKKNISPLPKSSGSSSQQDEHVLSRFPLPIFSRQQDKKVYRPVPQLPRFSAVPHNNMHSYLPQLQLRTYSFKIQQGRISSIPLHQPQPQPPRINPFAAPMFEVLGPFDKSVFDTPLPEEYVNEK